MDKKYIILCPFQESYMNIVIFLNLLKYRDAYILLMPHSIWEVILTY